jgi:hypothetical protein
MREGKMLIFDCLDSVPARADRISEFALVNSSVFPIQNTT